MTAVATPMPGMVVAVHVAPGDHVAAGERLVTVETMKCESAVCAPRAGRVGRLAAVGEVVRAGAQVAVVAPVAAKAAAPTPAEAVATALAAGDGWFTELDLDPHDRLVEVDRPLGEAGCGVVVGLMTHRFPGHLAPTSRVWLAGDPSAMMGAVAEEECRRILAAFDLAEARSIPVEWVALSAGAQISMDRGTENMDWCAAVVRRILEYTQRGGEVVVIVAGVSVGAQSYWNSCATMLGHCRGMLVMVDGAAMVLTGHRALATSGGVSADSDADLGGYDAVMGPNGQAHHRAATLREAYDLVLDHHRLLARTAGPQASDDPVDRDVTGSPYDGVGGYATVGEVLDVQHNPTRTLPFAIRPVMAALVDAGAPQLERWPDMDGAEGAVVWDSALGGRAVTLIGIESHPRPSGEAGDAWWAGGTLYPAAARKIARGITHASGRRPVVVLANLAGFDSSAWSLRNQQLEWGAEIARAVVNFRGPIVVVVIGRFHGGAYVVFNKNLNPELRMLALAGTRVSVIGGSAAAEVVLVRAVRSRAEQLHADGEVADLSADEAHRLARSGVAADFDEVHSVERALRMGSVDEVIAASALRPAVIRRLRAGHRQSGLEAVTNLGRWPADTRASSA